MFRAPLPGVLEKYGEGHRESPPVDDLMRRSVATPEGPARDAVQLELAALNERRMVCRDGGAHVWGPLTPLELVGETKRLMLAH
jgi:hypothetical protein